MSDLAATLSGGMSPGNPVTHGYYLSHTAVCSFLSFTVSRVASLQALFRVYVQKIANPVRY